MQPTPTPSKPLPLSERLAAQFPDGMTSEIVARTRSEIISAVGEVIAEATLGPLAKPLLFILKARKIYAESKAEALRKIKELEAVDIIGDIKSATYTVTEQTRERIDGFLGGELLKGTDGVPAAMSPQMQQLQVLVQLLTELDTDLATSEAALKATPPASPEEAERVLGALTKAHGELEPAQKSVDPTTVAAREKDEARSALVTDERTAVASTVDRTVGAAATQQGVDTVPAELPPATPQPVLQQDGSAVAVPQSVDNAPVQEGGASDTVREDAKRAPADAKQVPLPAAEPAARDAEHGEDEHGEYVDLRLVPREIADEILAERPTVDMRAVYMMVNHAVMDNHLFVSGVMGLGADDIALLQYRNPGLLIASRMEQASNDDLRTKDWTDFAKDIPGVPSTINLTEQEKAVLAGVRVAMQDPAHDTFVMTPESMQALRERIDAAGVKGPGGRATSLDVVTAVIDNHVHDVYLAKVETALGIEPSNNYQLLRQADIPDKIWETIGMLREALLKKA